MKSVVGALVNPSLGAIGLAAAALVFLAVLLRGSKAYGPILMVLGVVFLAYVYEAFHGGTVALAIPKVQASVSGNVAIGVSGLMYMFMLAPLLTVVKGLVLTVMKPGGNPKAASAPPEARDAALPPAPPS